MTAGVTNSPIRGHAPAERTITKFGVRGRVADVIIYFKFYHNQLRGFRAVRGQNGGLPLTLTVAFTTGQHYRAACDKHAIIFFRYFNVRSNNAITQKFTVRIKYLCCRTHERHGQNKSCCRRANTAWDFFQFLIYHIQLCTEWCCPHVHCTVVVSTRLQHGNYDTSSRCSLGQHVCDSEQSQLSINTISYLLI